MTYPIVCIVGRPNVGKSSLVNKIIGQRRLIVDDRPGVTRDRISVQAEWKNHYFTLVDTGGIFFDRVSEEDSNVFQKDIEFQVKTAITEADLILFLVDVDEGITPYDRYIARELQKQSKKVILVVNKAENPQRQMEASQFFELGFEELVPVSALHGNGVGDLLDQIVSSIPPVHIEEEHEHLISVAIAGKPNVGKSSLLNALSGQQRAIVSEVPGTTRDIIDLCIEEGGFTFKIIDTAGIRRKARIYDRVENYSVKRSIDAIEHADVALFVIDATQPLAEQEKKIAGIIEEKGKGCVILVNKWDAVERDTDTPRLYEQILYREFYFLRQAPILFVSAKTGQRIDRVFQQVIRVFEGYTRRIPTADLNQTVQQAVSQKSPPSYKGKRLKIYYVTQPSVKPPVFLFFVNNPDLVHFSYQRYLENQLRLAYGFEGVPIRLSFRRR